MKQFICSLVIAGCLLVSGWTAYGDGPADVVETKVTNVALFKNGYGFFSCEGSLPEGEETIVLDRVPRASLGTMWFGTSGTNSRVVDTKVVRRTVPLDRPAMNFEELIRSNPGAHARVVASETFEGTLLPVPAEFTYPDVTPLFPTGPERNLRGRPGSDPGRGRLRPEMFTVLTAQDEIVAVRFSDVRQLSLSGGSRTEFVEQREQPYLECRLEKAARGGAVHLHYLQAGASWIPGYEIELVDDDTATVRLKGTLVNDVEDLDDAQVHFVVGYPNFMYADVEEPLSGRQSLQQFLQSLTDSGSREPRGRRAMMLQQAFLNVDWFAEEMPAMPVMPTGGEFKEDLFYYPPVAATVKKGERLSFVLSESKAPYQHIYTWDVPDTIPLNRQGYYERRSGETPEPEPIWHSLRLENKAKQPWTTGSAFIVQDGVPLGQDMLRYTSVGGETIVRITRATDVAGQKQEFEIERQHNARQFYDDNYDLVTVRGELKLQNKRTKPVRATITKATTGTVEQTSPEAEVAVRAEGLTPVNQKSTLKWQIDLEPGDEQTLTYIVKVYVRS